MMRLIASSLLVAVLASTAPAAETLREISWTGLRDAGQLTAGEIVPGEPEMPEVLKIENTTNEPKSITLLEIENPGITASQYALTAKVRYDNVQGTSYLEMWNCFPSGRQHFTRTLGDSGPMMKVSGTSPWREVVLPFYITSGTERPNKLIVNMVFAGKGTVYLSPLRLQQGLSSSTTPPGQWWDDRTGGLIGGVAGGVFGCLGALIGILASLGKGRSFVMFLTTATALFGCGLLAVGIVAATQSQPYAVYYPLLLIGGLSAILMGSMRGILRKRYEQLELRKMEAMDAGTAV